MAEGLDYAPVRAVDPFAAILVDERLSISAAPAAARFSLRGSAESLAPAAAPLGAALPTRINTASGTPAGAALMLGPDEWLLLAERGEDLSAAIEAAASGPHALVDVSHRQIGITVSGPLAEAVLNAGCPLDLSEAAFPVGMATRTVFAKAEIVLWRTGAQTFRIEIWRSFASYLQGLLTDAAREYLA